MAVEIVKKGPVTTITLARPERRNAVDSETAERLVDAFTAFEEDEAARVAVFQGAGGVFSAGGDLKWLAETSGEGWLEGLQFPDLGSEELPPGPLGPSRLQLSKPTIAAVAGPAVAGGMELALWCDLRVMEEDAYFGVYNRRWGVPLIDGGTVRLPRLVGEGRALDIILTGRKVSAQEALAIGLCERVVAQGEALSAAEALAAEIARFPQECLRADRRSVYGQAGQPLIAAMRAEFAGGLPALRREGLSGAARFRDGKGRHGDRDDI